MTGWSRMAAIPVPDPSLAPTRPRLSRTRNGGSARDPPWAYQDLKRRRAMRLHVALLCATALGLCATSALAQRPSGRGPERRAPLLFKGIPLTPGQPAEGDSIPKKYRQQKPAFPPRGPPDPPPRPKDRGVVS